MVKPPASPEGQSGVEGDQGVLRLHAGLEELLQQPQGQTALPVGLGPLPIPSHRRTYRGAVPPLEIGARVPAHRLPIPSSGRRSRPPPSGAPAGSASGGPRPGPPGAWAPPSGRPAPPAPPGGQRGQSGPSSSIRSRPARPGTRRPAPGPPFRPAAAADAGRPRDPGSAPPQLSGRRPQQGGELTILSAHRRPAVLDPAVVLGGGRAGR